MLNRSFTLTMTIILAFSLIALSLAIHQSSTVIRSLGTITIPNLSIDSYSKSNYDTVLGPISTFHPSNTWDYDSAASQSFIGTASKITGVGFYLRKYGNPYGLLYAVIYSHSGTFGVNSTPGIELARSNPVEASTLSTTFSIVNFTFPEDQQITLQANVPYCVVLEGPTDGLLDDKNNIQIGGDGSFPRHGGNWARYRYGQWWAMKYYDMIFYIYGKLFSTCSIYGKVMHSDGVTPLSDAKVELLGYSIDTITAQDGTYSFNFLPARMYTLIFTAVGYQTVERNVNATAGGEFHVSDVLLVESPRFRVYGYVMYVDGSPANDVTAILYGDIIYMVDVNNEGFYEFQSVIQGDYWLEISNFNLSKYRQLGSRTLHVYTDITKNVTLAPRTEIGGTFPIPQDGLCYHAAFCSWEDTAAPLPEQARRDIDRFVSIVGKSLYAAENAGSICVNEDFWPMRDPNSWKLLLDEGLFDVFIFSIMPYLRSYPSDSDPINGPTATEWKIANGTYDEWIRTLARQTKAFRYPVMLKIGPEMNGNQGPSQPGGSWIADFGASPAAFIAAWKRIVDVFRVEEVRNVVWCISYNFESVGIYDFEDYYPGDDYVDWIGVDLYQISASDDPGTQLNAFYNWAVNKHKPLVVTEWGTNWYNKNIHDADRARYINNFFDEIEVKPEFKMIRYHWNSWWRFQDDNSSDYGYMPLTSAAYRERIANDRYLAYVCQTQTR